MTVRIPPSLKWLVNKHARLASQIKKLEKQVSKQSGIHQNLLWSNRRSEDESAENIHHLQMYLKQLQSDLATIDSTLLLHDIPINPEAIALINTQTGLRHLSHGAMTRLIFTYLKQVGEEPKSTSEIYTFIRANSKREMSLADEKMLRFSVRKRLHALHSSKKIKLVAQAKTSLEGRWILSEWTSISRIGRPPKPNITLE